MKPVVVSFCGPWETSSSGGVRLLTEIRGFQEFSRKEICDECFNVVKIQKEIPSSIELKRQKTDEFVHMPP